MTFRSTILSLAAALLGATALTGAQAADLPSTKVAPIAPVMTQWSPWMIRGRALFVIPQEKASLNIGGAPIVGGKVDISTSVVPELDITYFFTKNIAAELVLGVTPHNVKGAGALAGARIGSAWLLPPTLTLQYHFTDFGAFKPYIGAGVNYSLFYNQSEQPGFSNLDVKNKFGAAVQVGFDYMLDEHWGVNFDVKKIFLKTDWTAELGGTPISGKAKLDPWLIGAGITYRF